MDELQIISRQQASERSLSRSSTVSGAAAPGPEAIGGMLYLSILDEVGFGLIAVQPGGEILFANRAAARACRDPQSPITIDSGCLSLPRSEDRERTLKALAAACNGRRSMLDLGCREHRSCIALVPVLTAQLQPTVLLILGRVGASDALALQLFSKLHQLTPAECNVLIALSEGARPTQIACSNRVALSTVRTQVRSIRIKTGTRSLSELLQLIARLPLMPTVWTV